MSHKWFCYRKGDPFQGLKLGSCLTLRNERRHMCWQSKRFYWKRAPGWRAGGKGTQESSSVTWLAVSGFLVMGLVSGFSLAHHSDSASFLVVQALFSQEGRHREGFWEVVGRVVSPFDLSWALQVGGGY